MTDHLETVARAQAVAGKVYVAVVVRAVEKPEEAIAFCALVGKPAVLEDVEVVGVDCSTGTVGLAVNGAVPWACLGQPGSCSSEACAYKHSHWRRAGLG